MEDAYRHIQTSKILVPYFGQFRVVFHPLNLQRTTAGCREKPSVLKKISEGFRVFAAHFRTPVFASKQTVSFRTVTTNNRCSSADNTGAVETTISEGYV
mmetsp:Transcript_9789/g.24377  ORF Transcript_9789/g.24377 Transcript_9789/m.24377 type:complete len:99 (+) Transcript_9789:766-1062(+)